jgi:opacity protein-like surface antigen
MCIKKNLFVGVIALGLSPIALANGYMPAPADSWAPGVYVGLQAGYAMTNWDTDWDGAVDDSNGFAGRFSIGYDFHKNFAVEAGFGYVFNNPKWVGDTASYFGNTYAIDLMGVIKAPVVDDFGLFAKVGVNYLHTDSGDSIFGSTEVDNFNVAFGAGAYYDITKNVSMDISWMRYNGDITGTWADYQPYTDAFMLGIKYKFIM